MEVDDSVDVELEGSDDVELGVLFMFNWGFS